MKRTITNAISYLNNKFNGHIAMTADDAHAYVQQVIENATSEFIETYIKPACDLCKFSVTVPLDSDDNDAKNKRHEIELKLISYGYHIIETVFDGKNQTVVDWNMSDEEYQALKQQQINEPKPREIIE